MSDAAAGLLVALVCLGGFIVGLWWAALVVVSLWSEPHCLRAGFPHVNVTWNFQRYCVKREEQTDRVVPYVKAVVP